MAQFYAIQRFSYAYKNWEVDCFVPCTSTFVKETLKETQDVTTSLAHQTPSVYCKSVFMIVVFRA